MMKIMRMLFVIYLFAGKNNICSSTMSTIRTLIKKIRVLKYVNFMIIKSKKSIRMDTSFTDSPTKLETFK